MSSRDTILARIRAAVGSPVETTIPRDYRRTGSMAQDAVVELMIDRLVDYKATVHRATPDTLAEAVDVALGTARSVVAPPGLDDIVVSGCRRGDRTLTIDEIDTPLTAAQLDRIDAAVTAARVGVAISGTIILDAAPDQGRRAITLVPDTHVLVLHTDQITETVPEALARLDPTRPLTMVAGPSATSDIELERVEGVHGPRNLHVVLVG